MSVIRLLCVESNNEGGDIELNVNMGYGFMLAYILRLKGNKLKCGSEIHPHAYLFWTTMKKSKKESKSKTKGYLSSRAPLIVIVEKAKKRRNLVKKKDLPPLLAQPEESGSNSNEPLLKRKKRQVLEPIGEETDVV